MFKKIFYSTLNALIILFFITGCNNSDEPQTVNGKPVVVFNLGYEAATIDPQLASSTSGMIVDGMCMEGLLRFGRKSGEFIPGTAKSWDTSKDQKKWTFHIRENAKWSNNTPVTAFDFLYAFKRALDPVLKSQYAYLLYGIKNAEDFNKGKIIDFNKVGVKAIDDTTFEVKLSYPDPDFKYIMALPVSYPLNKPFDEKYQAAFSIGNQFNPAKMLYNGPYIIKDWTPQNQYNFIKNPHYWNNENIKLGNINFVMIKNFKASLDKYKNGNLDICRISGAHLKGLKDSKNIHKTNSGEIWYLEFNTNNFLFKNKKIRQAIAMAINKKQLCDNIMKDGSIPAYAYIPPNISGGVLHGKPVTFRKRFNKNYFSYNPQKAKELFKEALKELGLKLSEVNKKGISLLCDNRDTTLYEAEFIQQQLKNNLNLNISLTTVPAQTRLLNVNQQTYDFAYSGWDPDFNDPLNFLQVWITEGGNNDTAWSNKKYDELINASQITSNSTKKMKLLAEAEDILMTDLPIIPLYHPVDFWLIKPWLKNVVIRTTGIKVSFYWAYIKE